MGGLLGGEVNPRPNAGFDEELSNFVTFLSKAYNILILLQRGFDSPGIYFVEKKSGKMSE